MLRNIVNALFGDKPDQIHGVPLDKLQLDAARDRLEQRSAELEETRNKIEKMAQRMRRKRKAGGSA